MVVRGEKGKSCPGPVRKNIKEYPAVHPIIEQIWGQKNRRFNVTVRGPMNGRKPAQS